MRDGVEIVGNRIHLFTEEYYKALFKQVPGANFSARAGRWTFPLSMEVCRNLRQVFGREMSIGPRLTAWARAEVAKEKSQGALGRKLDGVALQRVPQAAPRLAEALANRPYQAVAARFAVEGRNTLNADTPGLGKTTETIAGIIESGVRGPYLVVAPKTSLDVVWERELHMRLDKPNVHVIDGSRAVRNKRLESALWDADVQHDTWIIINIEMVRTKSFWVCPECGEEWPASDYPKSSIVDCGHNPSRVRTRHDHEYPKLFDVEWGAIVMDECQRSLIRNTGRPTQTRAGAMLLRLSDEALRMALSGTPMRGKPQRLFGTLKWLGYPGGFWAWCERFWDVKQDGYGGARTIGAFREDRREAFNKMMDVYMIRRTKEEVSPDLPRKAYMGSPLDLDDPRSPVAVWLPMSPKQTLAYQQMLAQGSAEVEGGTLNAVGILAEMTRLKQFATAYGSLEQRNGEPHFVPGFPSNKFDWLVQFLTERNIIDGDEDPTGKVVIVSQFTETLNAFRAALTKLDVRSAIVTGQVTGRKRAEQIDVFNEPRSGVDVMFLNTTAGGVAVTLDVADDMVLLDETHVPDDQEQVEDRINNRRPEEKVVTRRYWYLKSLGTIEEAIARVNMERDRDQKQHLDGRRGVAYIREVYACMSELNGAKK